MSGLTLVTGGARSGKSSYVEKLAKETGRPVTFIATAEALDEDMARRIKKHRSDRPVEWATIEAPIDVATSVLTVPASDIVIVDCLTLWVSNLLFRYEADPDGDRTILRHAEELVNVVRTRGTTFVVTNEVGLGIVPESALARRYQDLLGRVNQRVAAASVRVILLVAGLPIQVR